MTQGSRRAIVLAACVVLTGTTVALAQSAPRPVIDRTNCDTVTDLLPASVLAWVKKGDLTLVLGQLSYEPGWEPAFLAASEANAGRYDVDAEGGLIDRSSNARPDHTYGLPFARIDPAEPKAGVQVMWNVSFIFLKTGALRVRFIFDWIGRNGFERVVNGEAASFPFDGQPMAVPNPDRTEQRQLFRAVGPASIEGTATLTWRYMDDRPDTVWGYLPALRRVRQLPAANRSDPLFGSDLVQDDGLMWAGKNQSFEWELVGRQELLVPTAAVDLVPLVAGRRGPLGQEWKTPVEYPGARLGWQTPGWSGAPWLPTNMVWVRRPVWIVEGHPKDPYYSYGRQIFYVDAALYKIYYKIVYTPAGEYWKTLFNDFGLATTPDGGERQVITAAAIGIDDRGDHATYANGAAPDAIAEYHSVALTADQFTISGLMHFGK